MPGRDAHADPVCADGIGHGVDDLDREAGTVLRGSAVGVVAVVGRRVQELVQQVAVGRVDLDSVHPCRDGIARGLHVLADEAGDFAGLQGTRRDVWFGPLHGHHLPRSGDGTGCDRFQSVLVVRMRDPARVHKLRDDIPTSGVNGVGDQPPARDLFVGVEPRHVQVALAYGTRSGAFGDDQTRTRTLCVVGGVELSGGVAFAGPVAGQRCHHEPLGQIPGSDPDGFKSA